MREIRINKEQVSHLVIRGLRKTNYVYLPKKVEKYLFGLFKRVYGAGYYYEGVYGDEPCYFEHELEEYDFVGIDGILFQLPKVTVFLGEKKITEEVFDDVETAKEWATKNFPNCEIVER